jgi:hypothetical protein
MIRGISRLKKNGNKIPRPAGRKRGSNRSHNWNGFVRWAVAFLLFIVLLFLLIAKRPDAQGIFGRYTPWIAAFLIILVLLSLLIPVAGSRMGVFGRFTPFAVAFLMVYVLLMCFVIYGNMRRPVEQRRVSLNF